MVLAAAAFLVRVGPASPQDRWEEVGGYSPATIAAQIAALFAASEFARLRGDDAAATFLEEYSDFLEGHVDEWTTATAGSLLDGARSYYVRIRPSAADDPTPPRNANDGEVVLPNEPPGSQAAFPAREIVDGGFLELVRYGIRSPHDPVVVDSVGVLDRLLKVDTPSGPVWRRYNHDGYGEREDGEPFEGWGKGRAWPLLTGERGHYELAAGRDPRPYVQAMEKFSSEAGFLPEQVWDEADRPKQHLALGRPTGSAMPLAWAHAEYLSLLRSVADGRPYALLPELARRYAGPRRHERKVEVWKPNHRTSAVRAGRRLRVIADEPFRLRWSRDDWATVEETPSGRTEVGVDFADVDVPETQRGAIRFTFYWPEADRWEGRDFAVDVEPPRRPA